MMSASEALNDQPECPLCHRTYTTWRAVTNHLRSDNPHKELDKAALREVLNALPKDRCPHCSKEFSQVHQHKKSCPDNPAKRTSPDDGSCHSQDCHKPQEGKKRGGEKKTNEAFLEAYRQRLRTHGNNLSEESTIPDYTSHINTMINKEVGRDQNFSAWRWVSSDPQEWLEPEVAGYYLSRSLGESTWKKFLAARKYLFEWSQEVLCKTKDDPQTRLARAQADDAKVSNAISRGQYRVGARKNSNKDRKAEKEGQRIDPALTGRIGKLSFWQRLDCKQALQSS